MESYRVELDSLHFHTPPGRRLPERVFDFYSRVATLSVDTLGWFRLEGDRLDDFYVEDGVFVADRFVSFLRCADGSRVGFFSPDGSTLDEAEVVLLGSDGDVRGLARDFDGFLRALAKGTTKIDDLDVREGEPAGRESFVAWVGEGEAVEEDVYDTTRVTSWLAAWGRARREHARSDDVRRALAAVLAAEVGLPTEPWRHTHATVQLAGPRFGLFYEGERFDLGAPIEVAVRALRDDDLRSLPEAGFWNEAHLKLDHEGVLQVQRVYLEPPGFAGVVVDDEGLRADHERAPRSAYWTPRWLRDALGRERGRE